MLFRYIFLLGSILLSAATLQAQTDSVLQLQTDSAAILVDAAVRKMSLEQHPNFPNKPKTFEFLTNTPSILWAVAKTPFKKGSILPLAAVVGSTALLIHYDQQITNSTKRFSIRNNIDTNTSYKILFQVGGTKILKAPRNLTSAFYMLGEGWVGLAIGGGIWISGKVNGDNRAKQTASDLFEGFLASAVTTQLIKRTTGRESPFAATRPGGRWQPFPSFKDYQTNTPTYDAFPSGHLTTMITYTTILADNYPEKKWIRPLGYALASLTSWAMINTEVHWAGDYPLAFAIGYVQGKVITSKHFKKKKKALVKL